MIEERLKELGIELPPPPEPVGNYIGAVQVGDLIFLGGVSNRVRGLPTGSCRSNVMGDRRSGRNP